MTIREKTGVGYDFSAISQQSGVDQLHDRMAGGAIIKDDY